MRLVYSTEQIEFVKDNYSKLGAKTCAKLLGLTFKNIHYIANKYKIKFFQDRQFVNFNEDLVDDKYFAYFLGFSWADANLHCYDRKDGITTPYYSFEINKKDFENIKWIFDSLGDFKQIDKFKKYRQPSLEATTNNKKLCHFLLNMDYRVKSYEQPTTLVSILSQASIRYFFRGYFDGDGSIVKNGKSYRTEISGPYEYRWDFVEDLLKKTDSRCSIYRKIEPETLHSNSKVVITDIKSQVSFLNFIYEDREIDKIGLERKYEKYLKIKQKFEDSFFNLEYDGKVFKFRTTKEARNVLKLSSRQYYKNIKSGKIIIK